MYKNKKYKFNRNYFNKINTSKKAYWLGYLYADGYLINTNKTKGIRLTSKDYELIKKFKINISSNHIIRKTIVNDVNYYFLVIYSKLITKQLTNQGIETNKSFIIKFPKLNKPLIRHFIRGYFDGDGSFSYYYAKQYCKNKFGQIKKYTSKNLKGIFSIACASLTFITKIRDILNSEIKSNRQKFNKINNCYILTYDGKNQLKRLFDYLYKGNKVCLLRKKIKFQKIF